MAIILGIHWGYHDSSATLFDDYKLIAAVQKERLSRVKKEGGDPSACIEEVLQIAGLKISDIDVAAFSRLFVERRMLKLSLWRKLLEYLQGKAHAPVDLAKRMHREKTTSPSDVLDLEKLRRHFKLPKRTKIHFYNHHEAHALPALFYTEWNNALIYTADGYGDNVNYSHRIFRDHSLTCLYGDDTWLTKAYEHNSIAKAYMFVTEALGFKPNSHEGKVTGLAAFGQPELVDEFLAPYTVDEAGNIHGSFSDDASHRKYYFDLCKKTTRENCAASIQEATERLLIQSISTILGREKVSHVGLAGGLFANVKLNQRIAELTGVDEIFVVPPMGDEGLTIGGVLGYLLERDGLQSWLSRRHKLKDVYTARDFDSVATARILACNRSIFKIDGAPAETAAKLIAGDAVVATFAGKMEFGPRALGARSILASPHRRDINDTINKRLERSEFMPFAPVVARQDAQIVFEINPINSYASEFMTVTCNVRKEWLDRIPAVVHVDGTARPQIIDRNRNPLYFDILEKFKNITGLPVLINTSFNVHEQPIINTPEEAAIALVDNRIDYLVTNEAVFGFHRS